MKRREFLYTAAVAATAAALPSCGNRRPEGKLYTSRYGNAQMKLTWFPYELQLRHTFTVATYSRTTTPGVQIRLEYDGLTGYGEASMPPYLGQSVESVTAFLGKVDLSRFRDPFQMEEILAYVDSLSPGDTAAKAAVEE